MKNKLIIWIIPLLLFGSGIAAISAVPQSWPCHSAGDLVPCIHPAHVAGDVVPCIHYCTNVYGYTVACHPAGDVAPCIHRAHVNDVVPCTHICY